MTTDLDTSFGISMQTPADFRRRWRTRQSEPDGITVMYQDACAVMDALKAENEALEAENEALKAQIPKARFKVGDKVRFIKGSSDDTFTVTAVVPTQQYYSLGAGVCSWAEDELKPAPIEPPTIEEFIAAYAGHKPMRPLLERYEAWKESQG